MVCSCYYYDCLPFLFFVLVFFSRLVRLYFSIWLIVRSIYTDCERQSTDRDIMDAHEIEIVCRENDGNKNTHIRFSPCSHSLSSLTRTHSRSCCRKVNIERFVGPLPLLLLPLMFLLLSWFFLLHFFFVLFLYFVLFFPTTEYTWRGNLTNTWQ